MTTPTSHATLIAHVIDWVRAHRQPGSAHDVQISAETDLLDTGLLDSFGMVDLILFLERRLGCKVDLLDADPKEFSVVGGLCRIALSHNQGGDRC